MGSGIAVPHAIVPELSEAIRSAFDKEEASGAKTVPAGDIAVDFANATATWRGTTYSLSPVGPAAQDLVLAGGLEALTRKRLGL